MWLPVTRAATARRYVDLLQRFAGLVAAQGISK